MSLRRVVVFQAIALLLACEAHALSELEVLRKIPPDVFQPYRMKDHPRTFQYFGAGRVLGPIQRLRQDGAMAVARRSDCDKIEMAEFSTNKSSLTNYVVFVDCENGSRFYVDQHLVVTKR